MSENKHPMEIGWEVVDQFNEYLESETDRRSGLAGPPSAELAHFIADAIIQDRLQTQDQSDKGGMREWPITL